MPDQHTDKHVTLAFVGTESAYATRLCTETPSHRLVAIQYKREHDLLNYANKALWPIERD
jgi:hypothetical protein